MNDFCFLPRIKKYYLCDDEKELLLYDAPYCRFFTQFSNIQDLVSYNCPIADF